MEKIWAPFYVSLANRLEIRFCKHLQDELLLKIDGSDSNANIKFPTFRPQNRYNSFLKRESEGWNKVLKIKNIATKQSIK